MFSCSILFPLSHSWGKAHYNLPPVTGGYPVGTKVSITCNHGYVQSGVTNITCQISGAWTQSNIKCVASK